MRQTGGHINVKWFGFSDAAGEIPNVGLRFVGWGVPSRVWKDTTHRAG